eukprot:CAMPEP_0176104432 /NCGR_PEP_ID=MMETSP0120_2-20121206/52402_1 /TAXON_ID=160619 /ORGANISM="Kryptoperidinium foliaceum, Strain CCMP 1326" /LENGTH=186 /DNA_ID=CAMNT_0017438537 /DNA_START=41 /DNA_END=601 /DNA_ORIENTATION=+
MSDGVVVAYRVVDESFFFDLKSIVVGVMIACLFNKLAQRNSTPSHGRSLKEDAWEAPSGVIVAYCPSRCVFDEHHRVVVPQGWAVCDGREGTPNLVDRFIFGGSGEQDRAGQLQQIGGSAKHRHRVATTLHCHGNTRYWAAPHCDEDRLDGDAVPLAMIENSTHEGDVDEHGHIPPYVRLLYIMKM